MNEAWKPYELDLLRNGRRRNVAEFPVLKVHGPKVLEHIFLANLNNGKVIEGHVLDYVEFILLALGQKRY